MGEAKRRRLMSAGTVYHHTSTLRTNLLWMSGVIELEGRSKGAIHPQLGVIKTDATIRRAMRDFPPLAWFTTKTSIPGVLANSQVAFVDEASGEMRMTLDGKDLANALALQRVAIGFRIADIGAIHWPDHPGYVTDEGKELNETARDQGDDPADWYVTESPVDLMLATEFWSASSISNPVLRPFPSYLPDMRKMVTLCRNTPGAFIPPSWLKPDQARALGAALGKPVLE